MSPDSAVPSSLPGPAKASPAHRILCMIVRQITAELLAMTGDGSKERSDRRRAVCHVRQIAMYVCHVALQMPLAEIGDAFGRDRTTVAHACHVVEDRRDDPAFDAFVAIIERLAETLLLLPGSRA
ncbi:chromosomal replication initiator DnaA [Rhizobium cremeum]|uniref:helix-turn-helix domain-containing protein n=1 Tax=Rhizobium cremeum TaxID=2813827 RepID=UPI001FD2479F|nr:helix-turn-helix domain-containing protein [Rhizobium cremeum]MCJ7996163.1 chromosomal replication initiator DnaA [Rhizobium cremeum]MCJ8001422.1 chromosomal replication initiator DnaA [Rhizobium cremeum]